MADESSHNVGEAFRYKGTMEVDELKELDEEIQWNGLRLQELLDEGVRLREKSSMVETKVK